MKITATVFSFIYELDEPGFNSRRRRNIVLFSETSRLALKPAPPPLQRIQGLFHGGSKGRDGKLTTPLHPVQRFRMSGAIPLLPLSLFMVYTRTNVPLPLAN